MGTGPPTKSRRPLVPNEPMKSTVFFDGACPLCRAEIGHYRATDADGALCFIDVSADGENLPDGLSRPQAMQRFHVLAADGTLLSGAAAFVEVWRRLPRWRRAAQFASLPGVMMLLEYSYRAFLPLRPFFSRLFGRLQRLRGTVDPEPRL
ncbi:MAG: DUF393 domain-containing protein [Rhizobiales bacterium]|nr:DUF393 domain-containing protein [Hyphomicrobiales bacterium]